MHTITLKSDHDFFIMLNDMVKALDTTKSELIRKSVLHYRGVLEKERLKMQIKRASMKSRADSLSISKEFDGGDGLKDV